MILFSREIVQIQPWRWQRWLILWSNHQVVPGQSHAGQRQQLPERAEGLLAHIHHQVPQIPPFLHHRHLHFQESEAREFWTVHLQVCSIIYPTICISWELYFSGFAKVSHELYTWYVAGRQTPLENNPPTSTSLVRGFFEGFFEYHVMTIWTVSTLIVVTFHLFDKSLFPGKPLKPVFQSNILSKRYWSSIWTKYRKSPTCVIIFYHSANSNDLLLKNTKYLKI